MQRAVRYGLDLLDVEVVVFRHVLQLPGGRRLDELRARDVHQHALAARGRPALGQAAVDGLGQLEVVGRRRVDGDVGLCAGVLDLGELVVVDLHGEGVSQRGGQRGGGVKVNNI